MSDDVEHTDGPWQIATSNSFRRVLNRRMQGVAIPVKQSDGHPDMCFPNGGPDGPDARLIAAAPNLLEAAKSLVHRVKKDHSASEKAISDKARAEYESLKDAIAKAEGRDNE